MRFAVTGDRLAQGGIGSSLALMRTAFALILVYGCWRVLAPFAPAIFFAIAIVVSTWSAHAWLLSRLGQRRVLASLLSCAFVGVVVVVPVMLLFVAFREAAIWMLALLDEWKTRGPDIAAWFSRVPFIGNHIGKWWNDLPMDSSAWLSQFGDPARKSLVAVARAFGNGLGQIILAALLLFALFRDGDRIGHRLEAIAFGMGGPLARESLHTVHRTIGGVMLGVLGTALAQAVVAIAGFMIAGVPNAFLLGALTFILSMAPIGPPLIWGGAAIWLEQNGHSGAAVFMALYGLFCISLVDNIVKPFLISRSSRVPFAVTFMGVIGGMLAFGVAGVFIGPALLAVVVNLGRQLWLAPVDEPTANGR
jgi:predicted PurR-regulated permease PerM